MSQFLTAAELAPMREALRAHPYGYTLPRDFYIDPGIYRADLQLVYYKTWIQAGFSAQIKKPGQFFTIQIGDYNILVVRGDDKQIRAFHNVCRHRGSKVCLQQKGSAPKIVCPYHQWTYNLDGSLIYARDMQKGFDAKDHGLRPVPIENVQGYLFICLADNPPDFAAFRELAEPYLAFNNLEKAKVAHQYDLIEEGNWKLVWENNRECYHCPSNHPELSRSFDADPAAYNAPIDAADGLTSKEAVAWHAAGIPSKFVAAPDYQYRFVRAPMLRGAYSQTMTGKPAVRIPQVKADGTVGSCLFYQYPSSWNHLQYDHTVSFQILPLSPDRTLLRSTWLVHEDAVEGEDYDLKTLTEVWIATNEQDRHLVKITQEGANNPAYEIGPYNELHETFVVQFIEWYRGIFTGSFGAARLQVVA